MAPPMGRHYAFVAHVILLLSIAHAAPRPPLPRIVAVGAVLCTPARPFASSVGNIGGGTWGSTYATARAVKAGHGALECAVCLAEFVDDGEKLCLLPGCCHVFHTACIDVWLAAHVTCPVCRADLADRAVAAAGHVLAADQAAPQVGEHGHHARDRIKRAVGFGGIADNVGGASEPVMVAAAPCIVQATLE